jgi:hypothetical protein
MIFTSGKEQKPGFLKKPGFFSNYGIDIKFSGAALGDPYFTR